MSLSPLEGFDRELYHQFYQRKRRKNTKQKFLIGEKKQGWKFWHPKNEGDWIFFSFFFLCFSFLLTRFFFGVGVGWMS